MSDEHGTTIDVEGIPRDVRHVITFEPIAPDVTRLTGARVPAFPRRRRATCQAGASRSASTSSSRSTPEASLKTPTGSRTRTTWRPALTHTATPWSGRERTRAAPPRPDRLAEPRRTPLAAAGRAAVRRGGDQRDRPAGRRGRAPARRRRPRGDRRPRRRPSHRRRRADGEWRGGGPGHRAPRRRAGDAHHARSSRPCACSSSGAGRAGSGYASGTSPRRRCARSPDCPYFDIDPAWRLVGRLQPAEPGATIPVPDVLGDVNDEPTPGVVELAIDGRVHRLAALESMPAACGWSSGTRPTGPRPTAAAGSLSPARCSRMAASRSTSTWPTTRRASSRPTRPARFRRTATGCRSGSRRASASFRSQHTRMSGDRATEQAMFRLGPMSPVMWD